MKLNNVLPGIFDGAKGLSDLAFGAAVVCQTASSAAFMLGIHPASMAKLMLLFVAPVTFIVHDFWTIESDNEGFATADDSSHIVSRKIPVFPTEFDSEFVHFFKNLGMMGGLVLFIEMVGQSNN